MQTPPHSPDAPADGTDAAGLPMELLRAFASQTPFVPGRRVFFRYRDLGVEKATHGRMRANVSSSIEGMTEPTGWHYHECEMQFVYSIRGTVTLEFEDGTVSTFGPGDAFFIPGGVRHNEIHISPDREAIEISFPGKIGTVACDRPEGLPAVLRPVQGT
jgi:mannose-6-phosphate isomerase-like protein (cupin superfamily)